MAGKSSLRHRITELFLLGLVLALLFDGPFVANARAFLLISQEFPQIPAKPLVWLTPPPMHMHLTLASVQGPIVADLYVPRRWIGTLPDHSASAIILAFGVKVPPSAKRDVLRFASTLSRLGYVVLWPRLRSLDEERPGAEQPGTFVQAFRYLERVTPVDPARISFIGLSVGASIAFVAATDPRITRRVHALVFFGGYYSIFDYLTSLDTHSDRFAGETVRWQPSSDAVKQARAVLRSEHASELLRIFRQKTRSGVRQVLETANRGEIAGLQRFSPSAHLTSFRARIFILHDRNDHYVPYIESEKLDHALPSRVHTAMLVTDVFQHVEPSGGTLKHLLGQLAQLYGFAYGALDYL